jgi:glycosyltransferase involved in cell wall biosynthesis
MKNGSLVSVIMAAYNVEQFLSEAIESILIQTYHNIELLIIIDKSIDRTKEIAEQYACRDARVQLVNIPERSKSIAAVRNRGIKEAKGDIIVIADADDISMPERIEKQVRLLNREKKCQICCTRTIKIDQDGKDGVVQYRPWLPKDIEMELHIRGSIGGQNMAFKASAFRLLGGYDETYQIGEDYHFAVKALKKGMTIMGIPEVLVKYRTNPYSITYNVPRTPWENPLNLTSAWDANVAAYFFDVSLVDLYNVQEQWINDQILAFVKDHNVVIWGGREESFCVPNFIEWASAHRIMVTAFVGNNPYCGVKNIDTQEVLNMMENGSRVVLTSSGLVRTYATEILIKKGYKAWTDFAYIESFILRLAEIRATRHLVS